MRKLAIIALCAVLVIAGGVAMCKINYPTYTYRYRMTVEVVVDNAVRSGSSVIEVQVHTQPNLLANPTIYPKVHGEAVFVDLGGGRNVVALLAAGPAGSNVDYPFRLVTQVFGVSYSDNDLPKLATLRGQAKLSESQLPTLVTFTDLNDPKTARIVAPREFEKTFGPGARLLGVTIEMTSDATVATGIERKLPWIGNYAIETEFERTLRASAPTGGSMTPGMNLKRER
jgi:hypothetical protein